MPAMDERTVERLVEAICDLGGPYERRGYQLEVLLPTGGAGGPRPNTTPQLGLLGSVRDRCYKQRPHCEGDIDRLVCRVCDPLEYGSEEVVEIFR